MKRIFENKSSLEVTLGGCDSININFVRIDGSADRIFLKGEDMYWFLNQVNQAVAQAKNKAEGRTLFPNLKAVK